jgi:prolyl 4-hydroxylase
MLFYMSDVEEGGETVFKLEGKDGPLDPGDYKRCDKGLKYKPRKGDALLFHAADPSGEIDKRALHGGCPVIKGTKWVMTKWVRNKGAY